MAIAAILTALDEQASSERQEIIEQAKAEAAAIIRDAGEQARTHKEARLARAHAVVEPKVAQMINAARLQNKRDIEAARAKAIDEVFAEARERLSHLRKDPARYEVLFRALVAEALETNGEAATAVIDAADEELAGRVVTAGTCSLQTSETPCGGVTILTCEGKVARRNTLDDRLNAVERSGTAKVAELLFG